MLNTVVKLTGPENWRQWNERFISEAKGKRLWHLIDPNSPTKGQFMPAPVKPRIEDFPRKAKVARSQSRTLRSSSVQSAPLPTEEAFEEEEQRGVTIVDLTETGQRLYEHAEKTWRFEVNQYAVESDAINHPTRWIRESVSPDIYDVTYSSSYNLDVWYANLKERAGMQTIVALAWVREWEMALVIAQDASVPGLHDSRGWWLHFQKAVKGAGFESWCQSYYNSNRELINSGKLSARKLARDFNELFSRMPK